MTKEDILEARDEAKRFINRANVALRRINENKHALYGCKETGTLRRASMDLTRALSQMRKYR